MPFPCSGMSRLSEADADVVEERHLYIRQKGHNWDLANTAVGAGTRCRHGWPQAVMHDPLRKPGTIGDVVRLTCPLLAEAIDAYEKGGAIARYNERLAEDKAWAEDMYNTNDAQRVLREQLCEGRPRRMGRASEVMGAEKVRVIMGTGLTAMRLNSTDVKCLHAHVADELVRGGNAIGQQVLQDLKADGVSVCGTAECCDHCNVSKPLTEARWTFKGTKKKLSRRVRKLRASGLLDAKPNQTAIVK